MWWPSDRVLQMRTVWQAAAASQQAGRHHARWQVLSPACHNEQQEAAAQRLTCGNISSVSVRPAYDTASWRHSASASPSAACWAGSFRRPRDRDSAGLRKEGGSLLLVVGDCCWRVACKGQGSLYVCVRCCPMIRVSEHETPLKGGKRLSCGVQRLVVRSPPANRAAPAAVPTQPCAMPQRATNSPSQSTRTCSASIHPHQVVHWPLRVAGRRLAAQRRGNGGHAGFRRAVGQ